MGRSRFDVRIRDDGSSTVTVRSGGSTYSVTTSNVTDIAHADSEARALDDEHMVVESTTANGQLDKIKSTMTKSL